MVRAGEVAGVLTDLKRLAVFARGRRHPGKSRGRDLHLFVIIVATGVVNSRSCRDPKSGDLPELRGELRASPAMLDTSAMRQVLV